MYCASVGLCNRTGAMCVWALQVKVLFLRQHGIIIMCQLKQNQSKQHENKNTDFALFDEFFLPRKPSTSRSHDGCGHELSMSW